MYNILKLFWCINVKNKIKNKKNIILIYFQAKNTFKNIIIIILNTIYWNSYNTCRIIGIPLLVGWVQGGEIETDLVPFN
jgi:hypothetical protein